MELKQYGRIESWPDILKGFITGFGNTLILLISRLILRGTPIKHWYLIMTSKLAITSTITPVSTLLYVKKLHRSPISTTRSPEQ